MIDDRIELRPNHYPDGPYLNSPCIHCQQMLKHTGAWSGVTWSPVEPSKDLSPRQQETEWSTCYSNEVARATYGGHEPWEAIPDRSA